MNELKDLRERKGVSLREAAKGIGMSAMYLSEIERGLKLPSRGMLKRVEEYYNTDLKEYFKEVKVRMLLRKSWSLFAEAKKVDVIDAKELWQ